MLPAECSFSTNLRDERSASFFKDRICKNAMKTIAHCIAPTVVTMKEQILIVSYLDAHFSPIGQNPSFLSVITLPMIRMRVERAQVPDKARKSLSLLSKESKRTNVMVTTAQIATRAHPTRVRLRYGRAEDTVTASRPEECRNHTKQKIASISAMRLQKICALRVVFRLSPICIITIGLSEKVRNLRRG